MSPEDKIVYYVTQKSKFVATTEVIGDYFYSNEQILDHLYYLWSHRTYTKLILFMQNVDSGIYIKDI